MFAGYGHDDVQLDTCRQSNEVLIFTAELRMSDTSIGGIVSASM